MMYNIPTRHINYSLPADIYTPNDHVSFAIFIYHTLFILCTYVDAESAINQSSCCPRRWIFPGLPLWWKWQLMIRIYNKLIRIFAYIIRTIRHGFHFISLISKCNNTFSYCKLIQRIINNATTTYVC